MSEPALFFPMVQKVRTFLVTGFFLFFRFPEIWLPVSSGFFCVIVYGQSSFGLSHCEANVASCCKTKMRLSSVKSLVTPTRSSHVFEFRVFNINIRSVRVLPPSPWPVPPVLEEKASMEAGEGGVCVTSFLSNSGVAKVHHDTIHVENVIL